MSSIAAPSRMKKSQLPLEAGCWWSISDLSPSALTQTEDLAPRWIVVGCHTHCVLSGLSWRGDISHWTAASLPQNADFVKPAHLRFDRWHEVCYSADQVTALSNFHKGLKMRPTAVTSSPIVISLILIGLLREQELMVAGSLADR